MLVWLVLSAGASESCPVGAIGSTSIEFITGARAAEREAERATAEMRAPIPTPPLGAVVARIERIDGQLANPAGQVVVFDSGGMQIGRFQPESEAPELPWANDWLMGVRGGEAGGLWWKTFVALIPEGAAFPVVVHVVDKAAAIRCTWSLAASGEVSRVWVKVVAEAAVVSDCPWPNGVETVITDEAWVEINGDRRAVIGERAWTPLVDDFRKCGWSEAADSLYSWRLKRRAVNKSVVIGTATMGLWFVVTPFHALASERHREAMETALRGQD